MLTQVISMGLSFLLLWAGRDKTWTPTFEGTRELRFTTAVVHYQAKMGLGDKPLVFEIRPARRLVNGSLSCAWVERSREWHSDIIGFSTAKECKTWKPEELALHEQCHRRMAHLDVEDGPNEHAEVKTCMAWYSAKERR